MIYEKERHEGRSFKMADSNKNMKTVSIIMSGLRYCCTNGRRMDLSTF